MVKQDTCDSFRLFEILEKYMYQPETFRFQNICQLPLNDRLKMVEKYYELDDIGTTYPPTHLSAHRFIDRSIDELNIIVHILSCKGSVISVRSQVFLVHTSV